MGGILKLPNQDVPTQRPGYKDGTHVFELPYPIDSQSYVHRIGRTGRAGNDGTAITLVSTQEYRELKRIQKEVGADLELSTFDVDSNLSKKERLEKLKESILDTPIDKDADTLLHTFQDMDRELLVKKLLSYILNIEKSSLKDKIGYDKGMVDKIFFNSKKSKRVKKSKKRGKK